MEQEMLVIKKGQEKKKYHNNTNYRFFLLLFLINLIKVFDKSEILINQKLVKYLYNLLKYSI